MSASRFGFSLLPFIGCRLTQTLSPCGTFPSAAQGFGPRPVKSSMRSKDPRTLMWMDIACAATALTVTRTWAEALLVIEADRGRLLYAHNAGTARHRSCVTPLTAV